MSFVIEDLPLETKDSKHTGKQCLVTMEIKKILEH